jgi:hypothetical protein
MSAKHTPGPWVNYGLVTPGPKEEVGYWCPGPGAWRCVANCSHEATGNGGALGELEANARLIAAAPELLAALQGLIDQRDRPHGFADLPWYEPAFEAARAAIAKAVQS